MTVSEKLFEDELEAFRVNIETAAQFFYGFQAVHYLSSKDKAVYNLLNRNPMFWNTNIGALRDSMFISLGRIFDKDGRTHNIFKLMEMAEDNPQLFKLSSPRWAKRSLSNQTSGSNIKDVYEPKLQDWQKICGYVCKWSGVYRANYQPIRDKVFAHRERIDSAKKSQLFAQTSYVELEKLFAFLDAVYEALWNLYNNGTKPVIRYRRHSLVQIFSQKATGQVSLIAGERVALDTKEFFEHQIKRALRK